MSITYANKADLVEVVKQMDGSEFDAFLGKVFEVRQPLKEAKLSVKETKLLKQINQGLPTELVRRYAILSKRCRQSKLTAAEQQELLQLTHQAESRDVERAAALLELAKLRRMPVRALMRQLEIQPAKTDGETENLPA